MKMELELIRTLLMDMEARACSNPKVSCHPAQIDGFTPQQISYHYWLLDNGGYIVAEKVTKFDTEVEDLPDEYRPCCMTWKGQEFIRTLHDTDIWRQAVDAAKRGGTQSLELVIEAGKRIAAKKLDKLFDMSST